MAVSLISEFVFLQEVPGRAPTPLQPQEEVLPFLSPCLEAEVAQCGAYRRQDVHFLCPLPSAANTIRHTQKPKPDPADSRGEV